MSSETEHDACTAAVPNLFSYKFWISNNKKKTNENESKQMYKPYRT